MKQFHVTLSLNDWIIKYSYVISFRVLVINL